MELFVLLPSKALQIMLRDGSEQIVGLLLRFFSRRLVKLAFNRFQCFFNFHPFIRRYSFFLCLQNK